MSLFDYRAAQEIVKVDPPFYALIMAAMRNEGIDENGVGVWVVSEDRPTPSTSPS